MKGLILFLCNYSWDEWVNEDRIQKVNDATLQKQRDLLQQFPQAELV